MSEFHYALGLDIGIGSVGWAVLRNQPNGEPDRIQDLGVRIFDKAEQPKTGASLAAPRRDARSARRRLRRHRHRLERIRYLMEQRGMMSVSDIQAMYAAGGFQKSPYQLRAEALDRPLSKEEAVRVLIHLAQRRGYKSNSTAEAAKDEKETGKVKTAIEENRRCMAEHGYRTVGEMMFRDERFWQKHPDGTRYHQTRNKAEDYRFTVERAAIVDEVRQIFAAQRRLGMVWMGEDMETAYLSILESQRSFDEGPGGDSPFSGGIGERVGACTFEPDEKRAAKATYTFEYFKLLQDLNRMRLTGMGMPPEPLDAAQRELLKSAPALFGNGFFRGSDDPRNAALNYGYAVMRAGIARNLVVHGLEPCIGLHHRSELNNFNLADDLIEPFRPVVDLYVTQNFSKDDDVLTPRQKAGLFNLTNYLVKQAGRRYRVMLSIDRVCTALANSVTAGENLLELPELIPLELHQYE